MDRIRLNCGQFEFSRENMPRNCPSVQLLLPVLADTLNPTLPCPIEEIGVSTDVVPCSVEDFPISPCFSLPSRLMLRGRNVLPKNPLHAILTAPSMFPARTVTLR